MTRISLRPAAVALAVALACGTAPVFAQSAAAPVSINIAAQPLAQALNDLARQAQLDLIVQPALVAGKTAPAVSGSLTPQQALDRLLAGSGLIAIVNGKTAVVNQAPVSSGQALPAVTVTADADVDGYVAKRSASGFKTNTSIVETPQSVSVITKKQLEDQKPRSITEALAYMPGAFTGLVGSSNRYDYVALRGFADSSVDSTLLDGLRLLSDQGSYTSMQIDPYFLERIDVVRGPASVVYGRASPGGLVSLTSLKPQYQHAGEAQVTVGSNDRREAAIDVTGPIDANGVAAFRFTALTRKLDSQFDHVKEERIAIAPSVSFNLSPDTHLLLQAYFQRDPDGSYHSGLPAEGTLYDRNGRKISRHFFDGDPRVDKYQREQQFIGYQFEHAFNDQLKFRQNFRYVRADSTLRQIYQVGWLAGDLLARSYSGSNEDTHGFTIDNQLESQFQTGAVKHTFLTGLDYQKRRVDGDWTWAGTITPINAFDPDYDGALAYTNPGGMPIDRHLDETGFYLQDQMEYGRWRFSLGGRQDWVKSSNQSGTGEPAKWDGSKFTMRAGAVYLFDNGLAPYIGYSEGFNPSLRNDAQNNILKPTETKQTEIGVRYQPKNSSTLLSAAVYDLRQENLATSLPGQFIYTPVGSVRARGLELEAHTQLTKQFALLASYTFTDMEFVKSNEGYGGNTPYQAPRHMASVWGEWNVVPAVSLGGGVRYVGSTWGDNENTFKIPHYTLLDLMLRVNLGEIAPQMKGMNLRVSANNLLDKQYVASCMNETYCYWGDERNVTATLTYKW